MKRKRESFRSLVRPCGVGWQVWQMPLDSELPSKLASEPIVVPTADAEQDVLAIPARHVVSAAIWIPTVDPAEFESAARLELELSGLPAPKSGASATVLRIVVREESRTLVSATVFPSDLPAMVSGLNFRHFEASPQLMQLPPDAATVWQEADDFVLCVTRGNAVVVWEVLETTASDADLSLWFRLVTTQLQAEDVIPRWLAWHDPAGVMKGRAIVLPSAAQWETSSGELSSPKWPEIEGNWQPPSALRVIDRSARIKKIRHLVVASAAAYAALILIALLVLGVMKIQVAGAQDELDALNAEVNSFAPVSRAWQLVAATVEPESFPLEILHHLVINLPPSGIRLTNLSIADGDILVEGEASSVTLASRFFASIQEDAEFQFTRWEMPPPSLLPNSTARFQMRGEVIGL